MMQNGRTAKRATFDTNVRLSLLESDMDEVEVIYGRLSEKIDKMTTRLTAAIVSFSLLAVAAIINLAVIVMFQ